MEELHSEGGFLAEIRDLGAVTGRMHTALASDGMLPTFAPEDPSDEALGLLTATIDEEIERTYDLDLAQRLGRAGWLTVHVPSATVEYGSTVRADPAAAHRYLADRTVRPVGALLRATAP